MNFTKLSCPYLGQKTPGTTAEKLAPGIILTEAHEYASSFSPDEGYIVVTVRSPGQNSASSLFCSFKNKQGEWSEPSELKFGMNAGQPFISFDGKYLFFTTGDPRVGSDIFWVSTKILDELRPKK